jgi:SAM-dependent methyltransferase
VKESEIRNASIHDQYLELVRLDAQKYFDDDLYCENLNCPVCASHASKREFDKFGFSYVSCEDCLTLYVNPRPKLDRLEEFYISSDSSRFWIEEFFKPVAEARREKIFLPRAQRVAEMLVDVSDPVVGDIGAGFGLFLEELKKVNQGIHSVAIEPSSEMAQICRTKNIEVIQCIIEKAEGNDSRFDFLCSFELFEHLHDPKTMIEGAFRLLKPGGKFLLTTLNGLGFDILMMWKESKSVFPPHHLNLSNPDAVSALLRRVGFEVVQAETPGELDWDIIESNIERESFSADRFWTYLANCGSEQAKNDLQFWLRKHSLSSHMSIIARKPMIS